MKERRDKLLSEFGFNYLEQIMQGWITFPQMWLPSTWPPMEAAAQMDMLKPRYSMRQKNPMIQ
jgi:hypothetical protein